ncbi:putative transcriptional regulator (plasmid) [Crinalium epipsammum PCC 9333]|uniref:Putative transcriptional regulator n=1 Tax=Crinalium epipsammum PCC 9333 TaxID=1173022 RepID=K9W6X3_9CYAN|nr:hypothetical protein [Crinalium epipsammum]AFZ15534.1 putative transcriptional regulator [Crinalium epipsammum PCC 9333]
MFQVVFNSTNLELILKSKLNRKKFLDYEINDELSTVIEEIEKYGHVGNAKPKKKLKLDVPEMIYEVEGVTFKLIYSILPEKNIVKIYELERKCYLQRTDLNSYLKTDFDYEKTDFNIIQADKPTKIIQTIELIYQGITTSYEIGLQLGHKAVKYKDIARHGQYKLQAARELKLVEKSKINGKNCYVLTEKGVLIAALGVEINSNGKFIKSNINKDISRQYQLMIRAMFDFLPVRFIYKDIILQGKNIEVNTIKNLIDTKFKPNYYSQKPSGTSERRAGCLKSWMVWIAGVSGIPLVHRDRKESQLYIDLFPLK